MNKYVIGIDFGTQSGRAVLVETDTGKVLTASVLEYANGVIDEKLPGSDIYLEPDWALQNPMDWLAVIRHTVPEVLRQSEISPQDVIGIGLDFTASTVLPVLADGTPLSEVKAYQENPHSWCKLWKHHAAQKYADRVIALAQEMNEAWLPRYGGKISSEWLLPKAFQILDEAQEIYNAAQKIVEGSDWVVWQLTGKLVRNACAAGYKALRHKRDGYPSQAFLKKLHPGLKNLYVEKVAEEVAAPGILAGKLVETWADWIGLPKGTPVAVPLIDAHAAVLGSGISTPGTIVLAMGTSTCHLTMSESEVLVEGIAGVVEDGIVPGLFGYEAGQSSVGDIFAWFIENAIPASYTEEAKTTGVSFHEILTQKAMHSPPGKSGLLALDWWNGNRSTLMDSNLSGLLIGCNLQTKPEEIYRALLESTAFGTRKIIEAFTSQGIQINTVMAGGGLTKNPLIMQIYADILNRDVAVAGMDQTAALGAAMLAAVAAGEPRGGYGSIPDAVAKMAPQPSRIFHPQPESAKIYEQLYVEYSRLYEYFGRGENNVMKTLRAISR